MPTATKNSADIFWNSFTSVKESNIAAGSNGTAVTGVPLLFNTALPSGLVKVTGKDANGKSGCPIDLTKTKILQLPKFLACKQNPWPCASDHNSHGLVAEAPVGELGSRWIMLLHIAHMDDGVNMNESIFFIKLD
jgi:hypothetical protein